MKKKYFPWVPAMIVILLSLPFYSAFISGHPVGSIYPDTDLDYFLRLHNVSFNSQNFFPKWNPLDICGAPVLSEIQSGVFYPFNVFFRWMSLFRAVTVFFWFHTILVSLLIYYLAKTLSFSKSAAMLSALSFSCCSHWVLGIYAGKLSNIATITWLPLYLILICKIKPDRNNLHIYAGISIVFALQFYAGHFQYMYYSLFVVFSFFQYKMFQIQKHFQIKMFIQSQIAFMIAMLIGLLLCLPQLIPVITYLKLTHRSSLTMAQVGHFSFPVYNLLTILFPKIFGNMQQCAYWGIYNLWEMSAYFGIMPLMLCFLAIRKKNASTRFFMVTTIAYLFIALGENTPLFDLFFYILPGFSWFRGHSKAIVIVCFCMSLIAGKGMENFLSNQKPYKNQFRILMFVVGTGCVLLLLCQTSMAQSIMNRFFEHILTQPGHYLPIHTITQLPDNYLAAIQYSISTISKGIFWLMISIFIIVWGKKWTVNRRMISILTIAIIELVGFCNYYIQPVAPSNFLMDQRVENFFNNDTSYFRILDLSQTHIQPTTFIQTITGDRPYIWDRYTKTINQFVFHHAVPGLKLPPLTSMKDGFLLMNVKYVIQKTNSPMAFKNCIRRYTDNRVDIYENTNVLDRLFIPQQVEWVNQQDDAYMKLNEKDVIRGKRVLIEQPEPRLPRKQSFDTQKSSARIINYCTDEIIIQANMETSGWIVLNDSWDKGWIALCDQHQQLDIHIANCIFRAVFVPKGKHEIRMIYRPNGFYLSIFVACILSGFVMGCILVCMSIPHFIKSSELS